MSRYLPKNTTAGDFNTQRTLSGSFFVIPERLASIRAVVLAFTANKQTNKQTLSIIYIDAPINDFCTIIVYYVFMRIVCSGGVNATSIIHTNYIVIKC